MLVLSIIIIGIGLALHLYKLKFHLSLSVSIQFDLYQHQSGEHIDNYLKKNQENLRCNTCNMVFHSFAMLFFIFIFLLNSHISKHQKT